MFISPAHAAAAEGAAFYTDPTFWVAVSFILLLVFAAKPAWGIVTRMMDDKIDSIREQLDEAARLREEAQELLASYKRKIAEAEQEAEAIIGEAREEAQRLRTKMTEDLEHSLQRREKLAIDRIAQAETEATQEVRAMASDIALTATRSILKDTVQGDKADQLIDDAIDELPDKLN